MCPASAIGRIANAAQRNDDRHKQGRASRRGWQGRKFSERRRRDLAARRQPVHGSQTDEKRNRDHGDPEQQQAEDEVRLDSHEHRETDHGQRAHHAAGGHHALRHRRRARQRVRTAAGQADDFECVDAQRVGDGLPQAIFLGDGKVDDGTGLVARHLDHTDRVVCPIERPPPVAVGEGVELLERGIAVFGAATNKLDRAFLSFLMTFTDGLTGSAFYHRYCINYLRCDRQS